MQSMQMTPEKVLSGRVNLVQRNLQALDERRATARAELERLDRKFAELQGRLRGLQAGANQVVKRNQQFSRP